MSIFSSVKTKLVVRLSLAVFGIMVLVSCANTSAKLNSLQVGMSKYDVYEVLGKPEILVTTDGDTEFLEYSLSKAPPATMQTVCAAGGLYTVALTAIFRLDDCKSKVNKYYVSLRGGRVNGFGQGDIAQQITIETPPQSVSEAKKPDAITGASGTGFIITPSGYVMTNQHVIDGADDISILLESGEALEAVVFREDSANDVAVLKVSYDQALPAVTFAYADKLKRGDEVMTLGYPLVNLQGQNQKATFGRINAKTGLRDDFRFLQVDIPIQPGNSGGPLINRRGDVVGMITATLKFTATLDKAGSLPQSVNFAVKSDYALPMISDLSVSTSSDLTKNLEFSDIATTLENSVVRVLAIKREQI